MNLSQLTNILSDKKMKDDLLNLIKRKIEIDQHIINLVELLKINNIPNSETTNQIFNKLTEIKEALNATTN